MSHSELTRLEILQLIEDRRLSQAQAATMLGLTDRQMRRLVQRYRVQGPEGLVSKKRGMRGNHRRPEASEITFWRSSSSVTQTLVRRWHARSSLSGMAWWCRARRCEAG
jgi:transposase-like protein